MNDLPEIILNINPSEAACLVSGWPGDFWIIAACRDQNVTRLTAVHSDMLKEKLFDVAASAAVYPPLDGFPATLVPIEIEQAVVAAVERHGTSLIPGAPGNHGQVAPRNIRPDRRLSVVPGQLASLFIRIRNRLASGRRQSRSGYLGPFDRREEHRADNFDDF